MLEIIGSTLAEEAAEVRKFEIYQLPDQALPFLLFFILLMFNKYSKYSTEPKTSLSEEYFIKA